MKTQIITQAHQTIANLEKGIAAIQGVSDTLLDQAYIDEDTGDVHIILPLHKMQEATETMRGTGWHLAGEWMDLRDISWRWSLFTFKDYNVCIQTRQECAYENRYAFPLYVD